MLAAISMHGHAPMLVPLIHAWSIIPKSKKYIWLRQHHILMYVRNSSKKRKYLIVKLFGTRSSDRSLYVCSCRYNSCINRWDVHIMKEDGWQLPGPSTTTGRWNRYYRSAVLPPPAT